MAQGEGMPIHRNPFEKGNLIIQFTVEYPAKEWFTENGCANVLKMAEILPPKEDQGESFNKSSNYSVYNRLAYMKGRLYTVYYVMILSFAYS